MAKQRAKAIFGIIIGLLVVGVVVANLLPVAIGQLNDPITVQQVQDEGTEYVVVADEVNSTVTASDATADTATIQLTDVESGTSVSKTVDVGTSATYQLEGGDVNVTVNSVTSGTPNTVDITYEVPDDYGWSGGEKGLYGIIGILLIVVIIAPVAGWAMDAMG